MVTMLIFRMLQSLQVNSVEKIILGLYNAEATPQSAPPGLAQSIDNPSWRQGPV